MKPLKINPEYRALVPRPTDEEYAAIERDIVNNQGALEPIIINEKVPPEILFGYIPFEICLKHSLFYDEKVMDFQSVEEERKYVIDSLAKQQATQREKEAKMGETSMVLANIFKAKQALVEARNLEDIITIRDTASMLVTWTKARGANEAALMAYEIKLRAERKAGQFLADMKEQDLLSKGAATPRGNIVLPRLQDLGIEKIESHRWQRRAQIPELEFEDYIENMKRKMQDASLQGAHVGQATGENEWYTPQDYIEAARLTMGSIDVDPASSETANRIVKATKYYTIREDGLKQKWEGNIWMNPPYSQPLITEFCNLLVEKLVDGEVKQACVLVNNATETIFYQNMLNYCKAVCFIKGRVRFIDKNGNESGAPLQGQTILYFGDRPRDFGLIFSKFGVVLYV